MSISSRRNKIVGAACAALMFASLPMVAMAENTAVPSGDNGMATIENGGDVTFAKRFNLVNTDNGSVLPAQRFKLNITPDETKSVVGVDDATTGAWKAISVAPIDLGGEDATGAWTINLPEYKAVGTYLYTLQEVPGDELGVTYDTTAYTLRVVVTNDGGTLVPHVAVLNGETKVDGITNEYDAGSLSVTKTVTGDQGDVKQEFNIRVTFTGVDGKEITGDVSYTPAGATEAVTIPGSAITTDGKVVDLVLKAGQTVTFTNIPDGVTYTVRELNQDKTAVVVGEGEKKVTYNKIEYTVDYDTKASGTIADPTTTTTITNAAGNAEVDTGVILNNAPYVVILAAAAVGITVFAVRRHARED